jgi:L-ascorbate 6-phosphate lactonase
VADVSGNPSGRRLTWLGQAGFRLVVAGTCVVVDPWSSSHEGRLIPSPPIALSAEGVDSLLITHEHLDHLDLPFLPVILERSPGVRVVLPAPLLPLVEHVVPERQLVPVQPGDVLDLEGLEARVVPAFHAVTTDDAFGDGAAAGGSPRFVGYVLDSESRVYHAGDTIVTDALTRVLEPLEIDVALLPINGRDAEREARGIVGNMDAGEAVELALSIGATRLVPYHWDGVAGNTVAPGSAADAAAGRLHVVVPAHFVPLDV